MDEPLFAYGTLRPGRAPVAIAAVVATLRPLGAARVRGRLYDLGPFAGAIPDRDAPAWIHGELVARTVDSPPLAWFDAYEGPGYRRVLTTAVDARGDRVPCWIYECARAPDASREIPGGEWNPRAGRGTPRGRGRRGPRSATRSSPR